MTKREEVQQLYDELEEVRGTIETYSPEYEKLDNAVWAALDRTMPAGKDSLDKPEAQAIDDITKHLAGEPVDKPKLLKTRATTKQARIVEQLFDADIQEALAKKRLIAEKVEKGWQLSSVVEGEKKRFGPVTATKQDALAQADMMRNPNLIPDDEITRDIIMRYRKTVDISALDKEVSDRLVTDLANLTDKDKSLIQRAKTIATQMAKNSALGIFAAPIATEEDFDTEKPWRNAIWKGAFITLALGGGASLGAVKLHKYLQRRGLRTTKEMLKALTRNLPELKRVVTDIASNTQREIERLGSARKELAILEDQARIQQQAGIVVARPYVVGDPAVKAMEKDFLTKCGISQATRAKLAQRFTEAIPSDVENIHADITNRVRAIGAVHSRRVGNSISWDIKRLGEVENIDANRLGRALLEEADRGIVSYSKAELEEAGRLVKAGRLKPYRQRRNVEMGRQLQGLQENFGRYINIDEVNRLVDEINPTLPDNVQLQHIIRVADEPLTLDQLRTAAEVANHRMNDILLQVEDLPLIEGLSEQGKAAAINIVARIGSATEYSRALEDIHRRPFGMITDWLKEEKLTYAYHLLTDEAKKTKADLQAVSELPYVGTTALPKNPAKSAHDEIRSLFPSFSITEINRLGRASTDANINQLKSVIEVKPDTDFASLPANIKKNPLARLAYDTGTSPETAMNNAISFKIIFGKALKKTMIDDPAYLTSTRIAATQKVVKTGMLISEMLKFGLPKSLITDAKGKPQGIYKTWAKLSAIEESLRKYGKKGDPILTAYIKDMYFPPEIKQLVDRAMDNYLRPPSAFSKHPDRNGMYWKIVRGMDVSLRAVKAQALGTLSFVNMNVISAMWRNYEEGTKADDYLSMMKWMATGEVPQGIKYGARELEEGIAVASQAGFIVQDLKRPIEIQGKWTRLFNNIFAGDIPWGQPMPPSVMNNINEEVETFVRGAHVMGQLKQGFSLNDAVRSALHAQFDYSADTYGTLFQRSFKAFPFIKWQINNIPFTFAKLFTQPRKIRTELFNVPKLGWQLLEPTIPDDVPTDLRYAPYYRLGQIPIPAVAYTDENGRQHATVVMMGRMIPSADPFFMDIDYSPEMRNNLWKWAGSFVGETMDEIYAATRPEVKAVGEFVQTWTGKRMFGRPLPSLPSSDIPKRLAYITAMQVIPLQRLFRLAELGGLDVRYLSPKIVTTSKDVTRRGLTRYSLIPFFTGGSTLYIYDMRQELAATGLAYQAADSEGKRQIADMMWRRESREAIMKQMREYEKEMTIEALKLRRDVDRYYSDVLTKGGK